MAAGLSTAGVSPHKVGFDMKLLASIFLFVALSAFGASPSFQQFDILYFNTNGNTIGLSGLLPSRVTITNTSGGVSNAVFTLTNSFQQILAVNRTNVTFTNAGTASVNTNFTLLSGNPNSAGGNPVWISQNGLGLNYSDFGGGDGFQITNGAGDLLYLALGDLSALENDSEWQADVGMLPTPSGRYAMLTYPTNGSPELQLTGVAFKPPVSNDVLTVDSRNGSDAKGRRGYYPFATITEAIRAGNPGDIISLIGTNYAASIGLKPGQSLVSLSPRTVIDGSVGMSNNAAIENLILTGPPVINSGATNVLLRDVSGGGFAQVDGLYADSGGSGKSRGSRFYSSYDGGAFLGGTNNNWESFDTDYIGMWNPNNVSPTNASVVRGFAIEGHGVYDFFGGSVTSSNGTHGSNACVYIGIGATANTVVRFFGTSLNFGNTNPAVTTTNVAVKNVPNAKIVGYAMENDAFHVYGTYEQKTNTSATWPRFASTPGGFAMVNSNGTVFIFTSLPGTTAWAATNKLAP